MRIAAAALSLLLMVGCREQVTPPEPPPSIDPPTTAGSIAQGNLDAQIEAQARQLARKPMCEDCRTGLVSLYLTRAQFFGRLSDYDRAEALAEEAVQRVPDGRTFLLRARVRATLHQFEAAQQDLREAAKRQAAAHEIAAEQASIDAALGRGADARSSLEKTLATRRTTPVLGAAAMLAGERGERDAARALFDEARQVYRDVSPFPIAYLDLQEGQLAERSGDLVHARERYAIAARRLPAYVAAVTHLALVTPDRDQAIRLLEPLADIEDPEPAAQLAQLLQLKGASSRATALLQRAQASYEALLAKHPEAFADHAARFWLGTGRDLSRALDWARKNASWRPTLDAYLLQLQAAEASGQSDAACATVSAMRQHGWQPLAVDRTMVRLGDACRRSAVGATR